MRLDAIPIFEMRFLPLIYCFQAINDENILKKKKNQNTSINHYKGVLNFDFLVKYLLTLIIIIILVNKIKMKQGEIFYETYVKEETRCLFLPKKREK